MRLRTFKTKFVVVVAVLIFSVAIFLLVPFIYRINDFLRKELTSFGLHLINDLTYATELGVAAEDPVLFQSYVEGIFREGDVVLVVIYNEKGHIIFSKKRVEVEEGIPPDIIKTLPIEKEPLKITRHTQKGEEIYEFYSPILTTQTMFPLIAQEGKVIGFVRIGLSLDRITRRSREVLFFGLSITILVILVGIVIFLVLTNKLMKPIGLLRKGAEIIGRGDLGYRLNIKTGDEIEELSNSFNQMAKDLGKSHAALQELKTVLEIKVKARTKELRELTENLEEQVKERTRELQERVNELEKFHKLTIGRELKMIELKKEIKGLKRELEKAKGRK
jgi:methyl-accepting chemotaxis protein